MSFTTYPSTEFKIRFVNALTGSVFLQIILIAAMKVLFIGDSISLFPFSYDPTCSGYGKSLTTTLKKNNISFDHWGGWHLPGGQCGNTETVFRKLIQEMKESKHYDQVYWNAGLHDVKTDHEHVPLDIYASNVVKISQLLSIHYSANVTFASTISVKYSHTKHNLSSIQQYNNKVRSVLPKNIRFHDQYGILQQRCGTHYSACDVHCRDGVHLSSIGDVLLGSYVFQHIQSLVN